MAARPTALIDRAENKNGNYGNASPGQPLVGWRLEADAVIDVGDVAGRWVLLHPHCIAIDVMKRYREKNEHDRKTKTPSRRQRHVGDILCDQDAERVDSRAAPANAVGNQTIPMATMASIRMARLIVTMIGTSGTYSSPMPIVKEPILNSSRQPPISSQGVFPSRSTAP